MTVPVIESNESNTGTGTVLSCNKPTDVAVGDLLLLFCNDDNSIGSLPQAKSGWTLLLTSGTTSQDCSHAVYYKIADGTEGSSEDVAILVSSDWCMFYVRISGVDTDDPINTYSTYEYGYASAAVASSVTTDRDYCLVLYGLCFDGGDGYPFSPSYGWAEGDEAQTSTHTAESSACWGYRELESQGASYNVTITCSVSDGYASSQVAINSLLPPPVLPIQLFTQQKRIAHTNLRR